MPIFQDDLGGGRRTPPPKFTTTPLSSSPAGTNMLTRKASEESIRTELCEGPLLGSLEDNEAIDSIPSLDFSIHGTSNRVELIERLKRGESPTWVPKKGVSCSLILEVYCAISDLLIARFSTPGVRTEHASQVSASIITHLSPTPFSRNLRDWTKSYT